MTSHIFTSPEGMWTYLFPWQHNTPLPRILHQEVSCKLGGPEWWAGTKSQLPPGPVLMDLGTGSWWETCVQFKITTFFFKYSVVPLWHSQFSWKSPQKACGLLIWSIFSGFTLTFTFHLGSCNDVCNIMLYWNVWYSIWLYMDPHCKGKTVVRQSHFYNGNMHIGQMAS